MDCRVCLAASCFHSICARGSWFTRKSPDPKIIIIALLHWKLSLRQVNHRNSLPSTPHSNTSSLQTPKAPLLYALLDCLLRILVSNCFPEFPNIKPLNSTKAQRAAALQEFIHRNKACTLNQTRPSAQLQQQMLNADTRRNKLSYIYLVTETSVETLLLWINVYIGAKAKPSRSFNCLLLTNFHLMTITTRRQEFDTFCNQSVWFPGHFSV